MTEYKEIEMFGIRAVKVMKRISTSIADWDLTKRLIYKAVKGKDML